MDLTEAEGILRRDVKNTQKNYIQKDLNETDNSPRTRHSGGEVKWVLGSITTNIASGGDGISAKLFQILKDDAFKVLYSICQQIWKSQQWTQDWKKLVFIPIPKKGNAKECSDYLTVALVSHASKVMLKILQVNLQHFVN